MYVGVCVCRHWICTQFSHVGWHKGAVSIPPPEGCLSEVGVYVLTFLCERVFRTCMCMYIHLCVVQ